MTPGKKRKWCFVARLESIEKVKKATKSLVEILVKEICALQLEVEVGNHGLKDRLKLRM